MQELTAEIASQLDNPVWHALTTAQRDVAMISSDARAARFPRRMSPFGAIETSDEAAWAAMLEVVGAGGAVVMGRADEVAVPSSWERIYHDTGTQYVCVAPVEPPDLATIDLGADDVEEMLELTSLTKPGPFVPRTHEMGHYIGLRREGRLVAMAGERLRGDTFSEISAVCVHPDARREGLAAALTTVLAHEIRDGGRVAILHVARGNDPAHAVYRGIGFEPRVEVVFSAWRHIDDSS